MTGDLQKRIGEEKIIAVLTIANVERVAPLVDVLLAAGINAVELTLRTEGAMEALKAMRAASDDILLGAGTVLNPEQVREVKDIGADFGVAPGCNANVLAAAAKAGLPFGPGIMTPSDIEQALEFDCRVLKFFPAESSGGLAHLKNMAAPYNHFGLQYIPLGGINTANASTYLSSPLICAVGGSWIAPHKLIDSGDWDAIAENAREARKIADRVDTVD